MNKRNIILDVKCAQFRVVHAGLLTKPVLKSNTASFVRKFGLFYQFHNA